MPLIDLKSDLTSCKYGHDRPGGSDSGQPFIISYSNGDIEVNTSARNPLALVGVSSIPAVPNFTTLLGRKKIGQFILDAVNGDDFIRGGGIGVLQASINDVFRISTFLASQPKGPIFLAKQIGLQLSNPILEARKGNVFGNLTGIGSFVGRITGGIVQPTRTYNLGINTLAQVGVNAFGGHFIRHGLSPLIDKNSLYESIVTNNNNLGNYDDNNWRNIGNRLVSLREKLNVDVQRSTRYYQDQIYITKTPTQSSSSPVTTTTKLTKKQQEELFKKELKLQDQGIPTGDFALQKSLQDVVVSSKKKKFRLFPKETDFIKIDPIGGPGSVYGIGPTIIRRFDYTNQKIKESFIRSALYSGKSQGNNQQPLASFNQNDSSLYNPEKLNYANGYGDIVTINTAKYPTWQRASREERVGSGRQDKLNSIPIFQLNENPTKGWVNIDNKIIDINDLVNFQIRAINGTTPSSNNWMIFRAYLTQFSDNVDATWNNTKYAGRGEDFYIYNGFNRKINIGFKVAALSAEEMKPMYQKLNYLMSNLMPDYEGVLMRGPLVKMTVGNWINGQDGILNSLSYTIPQESPWEVNITSIPDNNMVLPHIVEVQMTFTPIGSQTDGVNRLSQKYFTISNIAQAVSDANDVPRYITGSIPSATLKELPSPPPPPSAALPSTPLFYDEDPYFIGPTI